VAEGKERVIAQNEVFTVPGAPARAENEGFDEVPAAAWEKARLSKTPPSDDQGRPIPPLGALKGGDIDLFFLNEPRGDSVVRSPKTRVIGEVSGRLKAFLVARSGDRELKPDSQGRFAVEVDLAPGENTLSFRIVGPTPKDVRTETRKVIRR